MDLLMRAPRSAKKLRYFVPCGRVQIFVWFSGERQLNLIKAEGPKKLSGTEKNQIIPIFIIDHKNCLTLCIVVIKKFYQVCYFF